MLEPTEVAILSAIKRLTRDGGMTNGATVAKDLEAVGVQIEDSRLYGLMMGLLEDRYIKATLMTSTSSNAFQIVQLAPRGREVTRMEVDPFEQVMTEARSAIGSDGFARAFPGAYEPWRDAERLLWRDDATAQLTTIGHKVRESAQAFATELVESHRPSKVETNVALVEKRLGAVIAMHRTELSESKRQTLESLGDLWEATNKLVQRQAHGGQKEGEPVTWDDARRIVYLTMFLMIEFVTIFQALPGPPAQRDQPAAGPTVMGDEVGEALR
jgi:hypothetical protein